MSTADSPGLEWATARGMGALAEKMGFEFTEFSIERCVATMPVEGNTQPVGLLHGGAYVVLGESLGSMAANLHAGPGRLAVGVDISMFADSCRQLAVESADAKRRAAGTRRRPRSVAAADRKSGG